jgi:hypothetical protein
MQVTTLDFAPGMKPDIVANMLTYEFPNQYDAVMAFEVFEHVPFEKFAEEDWFALLVGVRDVVQSVHRARTK